MPFVTIEMYEGRTVEQKRNLVARVTEVISETVNTAPENVHIIIRDLPKHNTAHGGKLASD